MAGKTHEAGNPRRRLHVRKKQRTREKRSFVMWICVGFGTFIVLLFILAAKDSVGAEPIRTLLDSSDHNSQPRWIGKGGAVLYFIGICYIFLGICIVCDQFFVYSLGTICRTLNLSTGVAGATFMAAGSSAPDLFTSFVALANNHVSNEIEVGTIVGAAVFNIFLIIGVIAVFSGRRLALDYRPMVRDCLFYVPAIAGLVLVFWDGKIYWWEGLILVFLYGVYVVALKFNQTIMNVLPPPRSMFERFNANGIDLDALPCYYFESFASDEEIQNERSINDNAAPLLSSTNGETSDRNTTISDQDGRIDAARTTSQMDDAQEVEDDRNPFIVPRSRREQVFWLLSLPWNILFYYTAPDCSKERFRKWYMVTFAASILWIGVMSWFMVEWADDLDAVLGIPSDVMSEIVLAAGISLRSAMAAISVAQQGQGDVAVDNAIGSNVFDICLGLGLPWLFVIPFVGENSSFGKCVKVDNTNILPNILILFGVVVFYFLFVVYTRWTLNKRHGHLFIALYVVYVLYHIVAVWAFDIYDSKEDP